MYFQKSSVLKGAFDRLTVDSAVSFVEKSGEKGPQAEHGQAPPSSPSATVIAGCTGGARHPLSGFAA